MIGRLLVRLAAGLTLLTLVAGVPYLLTVLIGWPLPSRLPGWDEVTVVVTSPPTERLVINTLALVAWVSWLGFLWSLADEIVAVARHGPAPRRGRPTGRNPARLVATLLLTAAVTGSLATSTAAAGLDTARPAAAAVAAEAEAQGRSVVPETQGPRMEPAEPQAPGRRVFLWEDPPSLPAAPGTLVVEAAGRRHELPAGSAATLWELAEQLLGDPRRWPEIDQLNPHLRETGGHGDGQIIVRLPDDAAVATGHHGTPAGEPDAEHAPAGQLVYEVQPGDWMWHIAGRYLGEETRYPEIAALNPHLAASYPDYPDHIRPGDQLLLPPQARDRGDRGHATGVAAPAPAAAPADDQPPPESDSQQRPPGAQGTDRGQPRGEHGVWNPPTPGPRPTPDVEPSIPETPTPPGAAEDDPGRGDHTAAEHPGDPDGVVLGDGSWIPWTVAAAVTAAMAVVWLQRRRRYTPRRLDPVDPQQAEQVPDGGRYEPVDQHQATPGSEPAVVTRIRQSLRQRTRHTAAEPAGQDDPAPPVDVSPADAPLENTPPKDARLQDAPPEHGPTSTPPYPPDRADTADPPPLPEGGTGLVGPGAHAAARAALVAALSSGPPADPDSWAEVVAPADTMVTLLGADAVALGSWGRLRVTPDLDTALTLVETRLLGAARLLDEYQLTDLAGLRREAPAERPVPPLLLIAATPPPRQQMRTRNAVGLGDGLEVSALLLGEWEHGPTVHVDTDGTCHPTGAHTTPVGGVQQRMAVLDQRAAIDLLRTLREAHTGQPDAAEAARNRPHNEERTHIRRADAHHRQPDNGLPDTDPAPEPGTVALPVPKATARVLGPPVIHNWQAAGKPLRSAAVALLVYLAVHPDGVDPARIQEDFWPDSRRRLAATKLHTAASTLRHLLAASACAGPQHAAAYVVKQHGRYRLAPDTVEIDLWTLRAEHARARRAASDTERLAALRAACAAYHGELAEGSDHEWITGHREAARRLALDVHTNLAAMITDQDPHEAVRLLLRAVDIDPMAEAVYRQAMRACHRIGDTETISALLRRLAGQLDDIGAEPADETVELADKLRTDLHRRPGP